MKVNVLFTSIGRRVELIKAWKIAYADLGINGQIIGTDIDRLAAASNFVDSFHIHLYQVIFLFYVYLRIYENNIFYLFPNY